MGRIFGSEGRSFARELARAKRCVSRLARLPEVPELEELRTGLAAWLVRGARIDNVRFTGDCKFGERTITINPGGVNVIRWSATQNPAAAGDIGISTATGQIQQYQDGGVVNVSYYNVVEKPADETISSDSTLSADSALSQAVAASATLYYRFEFRVLQASATPGFKWQVTGSATATRIAVCTLAFDETANSVVEVAYNTALGVTRTLAMGANGYLMVLYGTILVNAAGTLRLDWAQNTSTAANTTVAASSSLTVFR